MIVIKLRSGLGIDGKLDSRHGYGSGGFGFILAFAGISLTIGQKGTELEITFSGDVVVKHSAGAERIQKGIQSPPSNSTQEQPSLNCLRT